MKRFIAFLISGCLAVVLLSLGISQEVPIGSLSGTIVMEENGKPLRNALVVITLDHPLEKYYWTDRNWNARTNENGRFTIRALPAGDYQLEVIAHNHSTSDRALTVVEGKPTDLEVKVAPEEYRLQIYAAQHVVAPGKPARMVVSGFVNSDTITVELRRLRTRAIAAAGGLSKAVDPLGYGQKVTQKQLDQLSEVLSTQNVPLTSREYEGDFNQTVTLPPLKQGLYLVSCKASGHSAFTFYNCTQIALVSESTSEKALCFVTDIDSGKPIGGVPLSIARKSGLEDVGRTDEHGLAWVALKDSGLLLAHRGEEIALCDFAGNEESGDGRDEGDDNSPTDPNTRVYTYAERPVYRPGDTVQFKAFVRHLSGDELKLPKAGTATVRLYDPNEDLLQVQHFPISSHGTIHGSFDTNKEASPGVYKMSVVADGGVDHYFVNLAAYRKPDYSIKVTPNKPRYCLGDTASATVECQYFFGGPVVGAKIQATIYRSPQWDSFEEEEDESPYGTDASDSSEGFVGGEYVQEIQAVTDGAGRAVISFPTKPDESESSSAISDEYDYTYSIQASISEEDGRSFDGSGSILVTRGNLRLSASTDPFIVVPGQAANVEIQTTSADPPNAPVANRPVQVVIESETFARHTVVYESPQKFTVQTDADGKARVPLKPKAEQSLRIRVSTTDEQGHPIKTETYLYVEGAPFDAEQGPKLRVRLDRKRYDVGDTLKAMISTSSAGGTALVTVQSDTIKLAHTVDLKGGSTIIRLPVLKSMSPNAFIHVAYVRGREFSETSRRVVVKRLDRHLTVTVVPDRSKTTPGSLVSFKIRTADQKGQGMAAEVSLGVVDESIYTIKKDTTDIERGLFPEKEDLVRTEYSFPEIYLDGGDKAGGSVPVRRKFLDTAAWAPVVETDRSGNARVSVRLPDNLTSWRATAVAATDDSVCGMTTSNVRASKPLMVRLDVPQFMVATDEERFGAAITNDSGSEQSVSFSVRTQGLNVAGTSTQRLELADGQTVAVPLDVTAPASGSGTIVAEVRGENASDAVEAHVPIAPHARLVVQNQSGSIGKTTTLPVSVLESRDPHSGGLSLTVTPNAVAGLLQSLNSLVQYPYGCVEQTMSRFLPAVLVTDTLKGTKLDRPDLDRRAASIAADGFARLAKMQHEDGAWGWWTYDESDPTMTAWVLDGLRRAQEAGYPRPSYLKLGKALDWAEARLHKPFKDDTLSSRLFLAYALAEYGIRKEPQSFLVSANLAKAGAGDLALAALTAHALAEREISQAALDHLDQKLASGNLGPKDQERWYWLWDDDEDRALALLALVNLRPDDPEVASLSHRILRSRGCDGWESTRSTSLAVAAMCKYIRQTPESIAPSDVAIALNGKEIKRLRIDPADIDSPNLKVEIPMTQLKVGPNELRIQNAGGAPYYATELRQYDVQAALPRIIDSSGLEVSRLYYLMEPRKAPDGSLKLLPSDRPISSAHAGDVIRCEITLTCKHPMDFVMVEDPIPSNCRVTDREDPMDGGNWSFWWSSIVIRDDRVSLFSRYMPKGSNKLEYTMRAEVPGSATALPTLAQNMYKPDQTSSGDGFSLEVH